MVTMAVDGRGMSTGLINVADEILFGDVSI